MACTCNNINCQCNTRSSCNCANDGRRGTRKIVDSHMVCNNRARAVFYKNGGCDVVPKAHVPSIKGMLTSNGPKQVGCQQWGINPSPESEGMDCLNYKFNRFRHG